jgi:hypothetical protein
MSVKIISSGLDTNVRRVIFVLTALVVVSGLAIMVFGSTKAYAQVPYGSKMTLVAHEGYYTPDPNRYVRVLSDGSVYVAPIDGMTETDATNAEFKKVHGLSDGNCVLFESTKYPGRFLRHTDYQIKLQARPWFSSWFDNSATFCLKQPVGGGASKGYESFNKKDYYIRRDGSALVLRHVGYESQYPADYDAIDFIEVGGPVTLNLYLNAWPIPEPWIVNEGEYRVVKVSGSCTGLASWWGTPPTKKVYLSLSHSSPWELPRHIESSATGTPYAGFYPWIKVYIPFEKLDGIPSTSQSGWVAKIKTGSTVCAW